MFFSKKMLKTHTKCSKNNVLRYVSAFFHPPTHYLFILFLNFASAKRTIRMIQSMTGYGKSVANFNGKKIHVEIKSLNSKALDLTTRVAPLYREKEIEVRNYIATELERGKIDFVLWIEKDESTGATPINTSFPFDMERTMSSMSGL